MFYHCSIFGSDDDECIFSRKLILEYINEEMRFILLILKIITNNLFITNDTCYTKLDDHTDADKKNHFIDCKFGIWLKDISDFFRRIDILQYAEFTIDIKLIDGIF